jgi:hypothetical protein
MDVSWVLKKADGTSITRTGKISPGVPPEQALREIVGGSAQVAGDFIFTMSAREAGSEMTGHQGPDGHLEGVLKFTLINRGTKTTISEMTYREGERHGRSIVYFPNGTLQQEGNWDRGRRTGLWVVNSEHVRPALKISFLNDELDGETTIFDLSGAIKAKGIYKSGRPVDGSFITHPMQLFELLSRNSYEKQLEAELAHYRNGERDDIKPIIIQIRI